MNTKNPSKITTINGGDDEDRLDWDAFGVALFDEELVCSFVLFELESFAFQFDRFCGEDFMTIVGQKGFDKILMLNLLI